MIERYEQFASSITTLYRYFQKIATDEMEKQGLKGSYAQYLLVMRRLKKGVTAAKLCEVCNKDKAAVSRAVSEMEEKGLIYREGVAGGYRARLFLTEAGERAANHVCNRAEIAVTVADEGLSEERRKDFYETLDLLAANLQKITQEGLPINEYM